ncbi:MAG: fumarate hydratase [Planctomycetes bacterium GWF2_50_10]|nr:MAG: fumarate hydratase [Planctomycetes bacterium GWF2_50_10]
MRTILFEDIVLAVEKLCIQAAHELPVDVLGAMTNALKYESNPRARDILSKLIENATIARDEFIPICQDTGVAVAFVEIGQSLTMAAPANFADATITDAINAGITLGYEKGYLRKSIVNEPLDKRQNTQTNTPAVIHYDFVAGEKIKITLMPKGGGCENKSQFKMFKPTADKAEVMGWITEVVKNAGADACPPFVVGVGLGGNFERSCLLAKKALLREMGTINSEPFYVRMEEELLKQINSLGIGPQGLGGDTTAIGVLIETAPCHIASLPAAVNIECHAHRHKSVTI